MDHENEASQHWYTSSSKQMNERLGYGITLGLVILGLTYLGFRSGMLTPWKFLILGSMIPPYWWAFRPYFPGRRPRAIAEYGFYIKAVFSTILAALLVLVVQVGLLTAIIVVFTLWVGPIIISPVIAFVSMILAAASIFIVPIVLGPEKTDHRS